MGSFRYRKSVRLAPGLKVNFNKKSISLTGGVRGAHVTRSFGGRSNYSVGVPGSGLWYRGNFGGKRQGQGGQSLGSQLASVSEGTTKAKIGNFFMWLGGLVWLLPVAAILAAIFGGLHNFGGVYALLLVIWTAWMIKLSWNRRQRQHRPLAAAAATAAASAAPTMFTPAEQQLRIYWRSLLADGLYSDEDEAALNAKLAELEVADDADLNDLHGRFGDLLWLSKIAMAKAGRLPAVENPTIMAKPGEIVHLEGGANLMRRHTQDGFSSFLFDDNGTFSITSQRLVFIGESRTLDVTYRRMNAVTFADEPKRIGEAELHSELVVHAGQRASCLFLGEGNADLAAAVIEAAAKHAAHS
jgi:hypothetical protein